MGWRTLLSIVAIATLLKASPTFAATTVTPEQARFALTSEKAFGLLTANWSVELKSVTNKAERARWEKTDLWFLRHSAYHGLRNLQGVNPALAYRVMERFAFLPLKITDQNPCGEFVPEKKRVVIHVGCTDSVNRVIHVYYQKLERLNRQLATNCVLREWWLNFFFHELLHLAKVPTNNDVESEHNMMFTKDFGFKGHRMERDLVFACAAQAFAGQAIYNPNESLNPAGNAGAKNTIQACLTCATAKVGDNDILTFESDPAKIQALTGQCQELISKQRQGCRNQ